MVTVVDTPRCDTCGYSMAGLGRLGDRAVCPECGRHQEIKLIDPRRLLGWWGMILLISAPWAMLPGVFLAGPPWLLGPPVLSLLLALGASSVFGPTRFTGTTRQVVASLGLWAVVNAIGLFLLVLVAIVMLR